MNILHYSLGLPPYRTGGLTKYSFDLMKEQVRNRDTVYLLFPGKISFLKGKTRVKYYKNESGVSAYELVNPLPVPLLDGISEPNKFMRSCNKEIFKNFLIKRHIQIIHIHTLMGLYKEFLEVCDELKIRKVYTTHDYFGICTKVNFIDNEGNICKERNLEKCLRCNKLGHSMKTIMILQSRTYRFLKNIGVISKLKLLVKKTAEKKSINSNSINKEIKITTEYKNNYKKLMEYYEDMFNYIDNFIFNSTVAKEVYNQYLKTNGQVISITHGDIRDNRKIKVYDHNRLKLTYLGPYKKYKGFCLLIDTMKELNKKYRSNVELNLYGDANTFEIEDNIKSYGRYSYNQLKDIFEKTDLLVVPSIWNETFGFIALEAVSYGVPVLITDKVGSKDIITNRTLKKGIVIRPFNKDLKTKIIEIINDRNILINLNKNILRDAFNMSMNTHSTKIKLLYNRMESTYK
ncbi:glycosyltransferase [uncultured Clostridium sp.]|uniref:glycosyltransferase n=1 Tax=uncultured Clostridium sp. TaxID=59620 RepID=UPI0028E447B6|nr:glycosyltransferase [uncultured Clostridium sp.]